MRAFYQNLASGLVGSNSIEPTDMVIEGNKLVASLHAELNNRDGDFIVMDNLNFWTFENENSRH